MKANPYLNRQPIADPTEFFGRERDIRWLLERITHPYAPQCCSLTGLRRIGKSSLLNFLVHPAGARRLYPEYFADGWRFLLVPADLSLNSPGNERSQEREEVATRTLSHMLRALRRRVRNELPPEIHGQVILPAVEGEWQETLEALDDTLHNLKTAGYRVIFLLDELDVAISWHTRLAHVLRAFVIEHDVAYVTASLRPLFELLEEGRTSPLYNLFSTRPLGLLEREEARALLTEPARRAGVTWSEMLTERLLDAVGGHPDLIKMAGSHLWDMLHAHGQEPSAAMVLEDLHADANALFTSIWENLQDSREREAVAALARGRRVAVVGEMLPALQQRAMVVEGEREPRLFGQLFAAWVLERSEATPGQDVPYLDGRWLYINGDRYQLTPTEAKLASVLLQRRGQTVSREELQRAIWTQVDPDSKALDTAVQRLREKIEQDRTDPRWLVTVRGEGYAFR